MPQSLKDRIVAADAAIETYSVSEAKVLQRNGQAILIDVREPEERLADGTIPGSLPIPRGVLEFCTLPESPSYVAALSSDTPLILFCASGGRSALAGLSLQELGRKHVGHLSGGFAAWKQQGGMVELLDALSSV